MFNTEYFMQVFRTVNIIIYMLEQVYDISLILKIKRYFIPYILQ